MRDYRKWDLRMLSLATVVAGWSKDPSTKVGAVIADNRHRIVSLGYNGLPAGVSDSSELLDDRETKYKLIRHAEANAVLFSGRQDLSGCTCYTAPLPPCASCASLLIQADITRIVSLVEHDDGTSDRWGEDFRLAERIYLETNVELMLYSIEDLEGFFLGEGDQQCD